ncbi:MAG: ABC transporter ATP-binding protein, partial [Coriobacteriia bacterium]|nr:ABC transporter ATP-binding protein [Coriobacteriia bacterium]
MKKSEIAGLVGFAVVFAALEGIGISLLLPILKYAEGGQTALENSSNAYWKAFAHLLNEVCIKPSLVVLLIMAFIPILLRNVMFYFNTWYSSVVTSRIMLRLRMKVVDAVYNADPEFYSRHPVGQLVGVVMGQTATAGAAVLSVINLLGILMLMMVYIAILLMLSVPLTFSALFFALIVALVNKAVLKWISANALKNARLSQRLMAKIVERMGQMQLVKLRHTKAEEAENIRSVSETMRGLSIKAAKVGATVEVVVDPILMVSVFVTLYIGIAVLGSTLAQLGLLLVMLTRLNAKTKEFNGSLQAISANAAGVKLVQEMYSAAQDANVMQSGDADFVHLEKSIEFKSVNFEYPDVYSADGVLISRGKKVLKGINAQVEAGSFTALVGRSGAGKSTLVELIPRMRDVTSGAIEFDGVDLKDFNIGTLRRGVGYVTQTPMLFNDSIYDNITYGLGFEPTDEQIRVALEKAYAMFVYDLPN